MSPTKGSAKLGWQIKPLGDVCITIQDGAHESPQQQFDSPGDGRFLYITSKNIRNNYLDLRNVSYVAEDFHERIYPRCSPSMGDVLLTKDGANTGNVTLNTIDEPFSLLSSVCLIKTKPNALRPAFLSYYIQSPDGLKSITGQMTGTAIKRIILRDIKLAEIPLPALAEQQRIVGILDEAFAGIASAKANDENNLQNARALFENHLQSVFTKSGPGWVEKRLGEVADTQYGLSEPLNEDGKGYKIFRMGEVQGGRLIDTGRMKFADITRTEFEKYKLQPDDVLFNRTNSFELVGKTGIFELEGDYCFASYLVRVLLKPNVMRPALLNYFMNSQRFQVSVKKKASKSINQANINATILSNESVRFPESLKEQNTIVTRLDKLREETYRLESIYRQKLSALAALKQSLLHQAFSGAL